ncbi:hypothetical protein A0H81_09527 [Grifola frondosa]|uniref:Uncharacterized protein n=1 Tax=Grifola frondosa TaxID=5627 RepID=A0A1C7M1E9_GRIFR|nr:hypothetical protein A0H81_09527 [Grifola frondosa]
MSPVKVVEMFIHGRITKKQHRRVGIRFADRLDKALAYMEEMPFRMDAVEETLKGNGRGGLPGLEQKMDVISAKIDARDAIVQTKMDGIITNVDALRSKVDKSAEVAGEVTKMSSALTTFTADANGQLTTIAKSTAYIHEHNVVTTNLTELKDAKNAEAMAILNRQQETAVAVIEGLRKQVVDLTLAKVKHPGEAEARDHPTKIDKAVGNDFDVGGEVARQNEKAAIETADDGQKAAGDVAGKDWRGPPRKPMKRLPTGVRDGLLSLANFTSAVLRFI